MKFKLERLCADWLRWIPLWFQPLSEELALNSAGERLRRAGLGDQTLLQFFLLKDMAGRTGQDQTPLSQLHCLQSECLAGTSSALHFAPLQQLSLLMATRAVVIPLPVVLLVVSSVLPLTLALPLLPRAGEMLITILLILLFNEDRVNRINSLWVQYSLSLCDGPRNTPKIKGDILEKSEIW